MLSTWSNLVIDNLDVLFDGSDDSIERLGDMIADGSFIARNGNLGGTGDATDNDIQTLRDSVVRNFFGIAIPEIWRMSGAYGFVIDTGIDCDEDVSDLLKDDVKKTRVCHNDKQYFLGEPKGTPSSSDDPYTFSVPPGVDSLGEDSRYGGITLEDVIIG